ncbi:imidazole glycerol phosphate synthase subunit HisH [Roseospira marina]|uniref:Imidazole glycerol phosphate synthase subunit HisH n=1 Tax=Roseospira marina TaxID=140057 RepID=A0A5M6I6K7_9PROT|nr:imidazole glycerol phosphate synthase subunit HisH [Roseospira marina]KAA5603874.1 imidazole glycerol phosphate synthase subunit HisH [Roseospira marina]MBB4313738.1 glutamine amidotransferase [Roseospira marina]MBB5086900.1 glutamine amidotransferase [Roseospira marina]
MTIAIIDYGSGNLRSAAKAFERATLEAQTAQTVRVTDRPDEVARADRVVLPGVGAFGDCRRGLGAVDGMIDALAEAVHGRGRPFLGICVGMQLMAREGREHGTHPGLDWVDGIVEPITPDDPALKIPHMGWNDLRVSATGHPVLEGIGTGQHAYFVHSYAMTMADPAQVLATVDYGGPVTAIVGRDTMVGTQFHPEKSQATGLRLITNFLRWAP